MRLRARFLPALILAAPVLGATSWQTPPEPIGRILDAPRPPAFSLSPDRQWFAEMSRPSLAPIAELAEPIVKIAGTRVNPRTNGPAREYAYRSLSLGRVGREARRELELPAGPRIRSVRWSPDGARLAFTLTQDEGIELWVVDVEAGQPRRLTGPVLNAAGGAPCDWLPGDEGLVCLVVPAGRGPAPEEIRVPSGPLVEESAGRRKPARTYQNLLQGPHDEALFEHYMTAAVEHVGLDGKRTRLVEPAIVDAVSPSPDGKLLLVETVHRPYSYHVPMSRFPQRIAVLDRRGRLVHELADLPLADDVPMKFGSTRRGPRSVNWRADRPATLHWVEALDGGDAGREAEKRDALHELDAPFTVEPRELWRSELRFGGVTWGRDGLALVSEWWWSTRQSRTWSIDPSKPVAPPQLDRRRGGRPAGPDRGEARRSVRHGGSRMRARAPPSCSSPARPSAPSTTPSSACVRSSVAASRSRE